MGTSPDRATVSVYEDAVTKGDAASKEIDEHVRGLMAWGIINLHSGHFEAAEHKAQEARSLALAGGLGREIGEASALVGLVAHMQGKWQDTFRSEFVKWFGSRCRRAGRRIDEAERIAGMWQGGPWVASGLGSPRRAAACAR